MFRPMAVPVPDEVAPNRHQQRREVLVLKIFRLVDAQPEAVEELWTQLSFLWVH